MKSSLSRTKRPVICLFCLCLDNNRDEDGNVPFKSENKRKVEPFLYDEMGTSRTKNKS